MNKPPLIADRQYKDYLLPQRCPWGKQEADGMTYLTDLDQSTKLAVTPE